MFDWVPLDKYALIHYLLVSLLVILSLVNSQSQSISSDQNFRFMNIAGWTYFLFILFYIGFRPIHGVFVDMTTYNNAFQHYANGGRLITDKDLLFNIFTKVSSQIMSAHIYFFVCAALYIVPIFIVCKKWFKDYWFYGFMFMIAAFSFWAYGTNGIRNGIAGSLFLLGISRDKRGSQILWIILSIGVHKSMLLPVGAFLLSNFYNKPKLFIFFWFLCIPLSLVSGGGVFENLIASIGFDDKRLGYLTSGADANLFEKTGFRWDFLLYSSTAVMAGWYYIVKRKYNDKIYFWLFNTYVISNAFWILIIRANYSNRFAYLSWFMIGLVIIYPLLKRFVLPQQYKMIGIIFILYFSFTFFMSLTKYF